jgi:hypothetical protein
MSRPPAGSVGSGSAARGGAGSAFNHPVPQVNGIGPSRGLSLPPPDGAAGPASSRSENGQAAGTGDGVLLRLALWLADVAAETARAATAPAAAASRSAGRAGEPPVVESAS